MCFRDRTFLTTFEAVLVPPTFLRPATFRYVGYIKKPGSMAGSVPKAQVLACYDCLNGADVCTSAAVGACIGIDETSIALFAYCLNGTLGFASAAVGALICNFVSHE